jgi:hypothetical protein
MSPRELQSHYTQWATHHVGAALHSPAGAIPNLRPQALDSLHSVFYLNTVLCQQFSSQLQRRIIVP